jgi:hypothetical protein
MPETHPVPMTRDDAYEEIAACYQGVLVMELDEALRDSGIEDEATRRRVCARLLFGLGNFHDQYWFRAGGRRMHPLLCFSEAFLDTDTPLSGLGTVYAPSPSFAFHEYADGAVTWYFEDRDADGDEPEIGLVGDD